MAKTSTNARTTPATKRAKTTKTASAASAQPTGKATGSGKAKAKAKTVTTSTPKKTRQKTAAPADLATPVKATTRRRTQTARTSPTITPAERQRMIAEAAFFIAEKRGFIPGGHDADWAQAEQDIAARFPLS